ncbi:TadE/TadG family type IV pilus assembly protein [Rhizobium sp. NFR03]|uniref:TadE family protein n=1 Tax=Rhizobium sp. NFR03 TaxID=1566263 RepID=UPI0008D38C7F|nr:TadE/TadG family type IV pilus assembly protein [Rhizobium sp. NFR03]SES21818.1 Flp pilus assembly protein TadG [Rhizobium sp. NFR03]
MSIMSRLTRRASGVAAIEFAFIAPLFLGVMFTMVAWGLYLGATHSVQQIAADTARAAIAGLSASERNALASAYIGSMKPGEFALINQKKLNVLVEDDKVRPNQFTVKLTYDASDLPIWNLMTFALPDTIIARSATIRIGGA